MRPGPLVFALATACLAVCCRGTGGPRPSRAAPPSSVLAEKERIDPALLPGLLALERAVADGDDRSARAILTRLMARRPRGAALELARGFERILDGRRWAAALDLALRAEEVPGEAVGAYRVWLTARDTAGVPLTLRPGPLRLTRTLVAVAPDGSEQRSVESTSIPPIEPLALAPGESVAREIAVQALPPTFGVLALRCRFELQFLAGEVEARGERYPAWRVAARPAVCVRLAEELSTEPVDPAELADYAEGGRIAVAAALERAARIPPERYAQALNRLAAPAARLPRPDLEALLPALRWLAGPIRAAGDVDGWRSYLRERARAGERARLDLPTPGS